MSAGFFCLIVVAVDALVVAVAAAFVVAVAAVLEGVSVVAVLGSVVWPGSVVTVISPLLGLLSSRTCNPTMPMITSRPTSAAPRAAGGSPWLRGPWVPRLIGALG